MARHPSDRSTRVLAPGGGAVASVEVALSPLEVAALRRVAKVGVDVLVALGDITRTGAVDEALRRLHAAPKGVSLEALEAKALVMFAERGIVILRALGEVGDEAAAESGLVKLRAATPSR